jgi:tight adherence protein B
VRRLALALVALALVAPASALAAEGVQLKEPDFHAYPEVTITAVTATPSKRAPVLRENGQPVSGLSAQNLGRAKSVVLAIDRSRSMRGKAFADAIAAARSFVAAKPVADRISVVAFGSKSTSLTGFSSATIDADIALRTLSVDDRQGTALNDAIVQSAAALRAEKIPSKLLILVTDGTDVSSAATEAAAIAAARRAGVAVYTIGLSSEQFAPDALQRVSGGTGGEYWRAASSAALNSVYASIAARLQRTWQLRYVTAARPGDTLDLDVTVAGSGSASLEASVPGKSERGSSTTVLPGAVDGGAGSLAISLLVGLLVLVAALFVGRAGRESKLRRRLAPHVEERRAAGAPKERFEAGKALMKATEAACAHLSLWRKTHKLLERADVPLRTVEFLYIAAGGGVGAALLALLLKGSALLALVALAVGTLVPFVYLQVKAKKRLAAFDELLPDLLLTIAASLKAGHSFKQGLQAVVDEDQPPASKEFKRVLTEARLGRPLDEALQEMAERIGSKNLEFVITAVTIQSQVGGSLAGLFDMVADAVRNRQQFARKIKSLTAMGRASAYVLLALPFGLGGVLMFINKSYMEPLYQTSTGQMMIGAGLAMMTVGALLIRKIVSFKG